LYTAVKIHEPEAMDPQLVATLSRGVFAPNEIEAMERQMLPALNWRLNPPTALSFCREFLKLISEEAMDKTMRETAFDLTKLQTELAVREYAFIAVKPSTVAFCSFMNSLESLIVDEQMLGDIGVIVAETIGIDCNADEVIQVQDCLYESIDARHNQTSSSDKKAQGTEAAGEQHRESEVPRREVRRTDSSRSVSLLR
jgi:hypothetical protein